MSGLRRFVTPRAGAAPWEFATQTRPAPAGEVCELCGVDIADEHPHLVNVESRSLKCTCRPCYLLFTPEGAGQGRYLAVPERYLSDPGSTISAAQWDSLQVPVATAFFFVNSELDRVVALYPSPAGATESLLDLGAWSQIAEQNALIGQLLPDVEALFVHRTHERNVALVVPIDVCYELVGRIRMHWSGFDGGAEVRADIEEFLTRAAARARAVAPRV
jgi:hypothetical protein